MAVRFGIRSALSITAVYAALLVAMQPLGEAGIAAAIVVATAIGGMIVVASRRDFVAIVRAVIWTIVGSMVGLVFISPIILLNQYRYDHGFGETAISNIIGGVIGALCGGLIASLITQSRSWSSGSANRLTTGDDESNTDGRTKD